MDIRHSHKGFSLIEILIVIVIMGLVASSMMSLFISNEQSSGTQLEVADAQQNLRAVMDIMTDDIQMAGFLIPTTNSAIEAVPAGTPLPVTLVPAGGVAPIFRLRMATTNFQIARLTSEVAVTTGGGPFTFTTATTEMARLFRDKDNVRLLTTPAHGQRIDQVFTVDGTPAGTSVPISNFPADANFNAADLLIKVDSAASPHPYTIDYYLKAGANPNRFILARQVNGTEEEIAPDIAAVTLDYLPSAAAPEAVRVTLTASALDFTSKADKARQLVKVITLKN